MRALAMLLFIGSGLAMLAFEIFWFSVWWGGIGTIVAIAVPPIAALFPLIYLFMEGFSALYFGLWGAGIAGAILHDRAN